MDNFPQVIHSHLLSHHKASSRFSTFPQLLLLLLLYIFNINGSSYLGGISRLYNNRGLKFYILFNKFQFSKKRRGFSEKPYWMIITFRLPLKLFLKDLYNMKSRFRKPNFNIENYLKYEVIKYGTDI